MNLNILIFGLAFTTITGADKLLAEPGPDWTAGNPPAIASGTGKVLECPDSIARNEKFFIYIPKGFDPNDTSTSYGVVVFISASDEDGSVPRGWQPVLDSHRLFYIQPSRVGNKQDGARRVNLAITSERIIKRYFNIDANRTYISGISGGSRIASLVAFTNPLLFHGTIQNCGTDFYQAVPRVAVTDTDLKNHPEPYGLLWCNNPQAAKANVRFVLITGPGDFRHNFILDIFHGGFEAQGFKALLLDIPGMRHEICSGQTLEKAITFLEVPDQP